MSARQSNQDRIGPNWFLFVFAAALLVLLAWLFLSRVVAPASDAAGADDPAAGAAATEGPILGGLSTSDGAAAAPTADPNAPAAPAADPNAPAAQPPVAVGPAGAVEGAVPAPANLPSPLPSCPAVDVGCGAWAAPPGAPSLQLRPSPSLGSAVSVELPAGAEVYLLEVLRGGPEGTWWRLRTADGFEGWINGEDLVRASQQ